MKKVFMLRGNEMYRCLSFLRRGDYMPGRRCHVLCAEQTPILENNIMKSQGWRQEFSDGGLIRPTRGLKYSFQGTINAKNLRKNCFPPSDGGLACSDGGL